MYFTQDILLRYTSHLPTPSNNLTNLVIIVRVEFKKVAIFSCAYRPDDKEREGTGRTRFIQSYGKHTIPRRMETLPQYLQRTIIILSV